ncbi:predicted protein [Streptomyces viridosporus ATCC 14672]|nr:predicted protein [Streptomyces viridosporus ATCC 14672]
MTPPAPPPEHPRVGGEDLTPAGRLIIEGGTPPHRRGGQDVTRDALVAQRNTPASAGKTMSRPQG